MNEILIMGTPVAPGNRGVMALGASLVDLCKSAAGDGFCVAFLQVHKPAEDVLVRTSRGDIKVPVITCRMSPKARLSEHLLWIFLMSLVHRVLPYNGLRSLIRRHVPWIKAVQEAALVGDVRGGDSFSDIYGLKRFVIASLPVFSVILVKGEIVHFPQTYGPFKSRITRSIARVLLRYSSSTIARDSLSRHFASTLAGGNIHVGLSPDVAFSLHPVTPASIETSTGSSRLDIKGKIVGLNINGLMFFGGYTGRNQFGLRLDYRRFLLSLLVSLLDVYTDEVFLVPHTFAKAGDPESDNEASRLIREELPSGLQERVRVVSGDYDQHELKGIIGMCDFFIGSRMHSCIAALSQGIPCVGVAYSMKFKGVFESVGMEDWVVDGRELDELQAVARVIELFRMRDHVREELAVNAESARGRLKEVFAEIFSRVSQPVA